MLAARGRRTLAFLNDGLRKITTPSKYLPERNWCHPHVVGETLSNEAARGQRQHAYRYALLVEHRLGFLDS